MDISNPDKFVSQVYYRSSDKDIFFFSNYSATKEHVLKAKFSVQDKNAWLWNPETGERFLYPLQNNESDIHLGPGESRLIVFDGEQGGQKFTEPDTSKKTSIIIQSPWKLTLKDVDGKSRSLILDKLIDFSQREDLKTFAGTIIYENAFKLADEKNVKYLQLGETHGVAEIKINNQKIGMQWYGDPVYDISRFVKKGNNTIQVKLITTLGNYMKSLKDNKVAQTWTSHQPFFSIGMLGSVRIM